MNESLSFGRYTIVGHDVRGYGRLDGRRQQQVQSDLKAMIGDAADQSGLRRTEWSRQESGDGELAILPRSESELRVVDDYVRHLAHRLRLHNLDRVDDLRLGMRLVIHHGPAVGGAMGTAGEGVVRAARLLDSTEARDALAAAGGDRLLVVVSETVFETSVGPGHTTLDPGLFVATRIHTKEGPVLAYFYVPDLPRPGAPPATLTEAAPDDRRKNSRSVTNVIENATFQKAVFGFEAGSD